jgi:hypothetical protein
MNKLNKILCDEWNSNKNINPITKRSIKPNGPVYNNFEKNCNKLGNDKKIKDIKKGSKNICDEWLNNPNINPETGKAIKKNGPVYKRLLKECEKKKDKSKSKSSSLSSSSKTLKLCDEWKKNPTINPETGYKIKIDGPKYKYFKTLCMNLNKKVKSSSQHSFHTPKSSSHHSSYHSFHTNASSLSNISMKELKELLNHDKYFKEELEKKVEKLSDLIKSSSSSQQSQEYKYSSDKSSSEINPFFGHHNDYKYKNPRYKSPSQSSS